MVSSRSLSCLGSSLSCDICPKKWRSYSTVTYFRPCGWRFEQKQVSFPRKRHNLAIMNENGAGDDSERVKGEPSTVVIERPPRFNILKGKPWPFGATYRDGGVNFALCSNGASSVTLCLMSLSDLQENKTSEQIYLDPLINKTGDVWHIFLMGNFEDMLYGYRVDGEFFPEKGHFFDSLKILLDPYAKAVVSRGEYGVPGPGGDCWPQMAGMVPSPKNDFDWEGDLPLRLPQKDLIIYEMHVRGFTKHDSSEANFPGTYRGMVEKLDHLEELGINAIELMPCHEFNELEYYSYNPVLDDHKVNFWGYSTVNFFSPMMRYSSSGMQNCGRDAINEFKLLVREAHKRGIEVIMDVVFNHTAEGNEKGPTFSFRGLDSCVYYMLAPKGEFYNYSGCGNTVNCNHPVVRQFIVDCLRYWVTEMHVDGFRFDLASIMTRSCSLWDAANAFGSPIEGHSITTGTPLSNPPLIDLISNDPVLNGIKLIAEAWDAGGLYQVGGFPHHGVWSEWNGQYRDIVRQFIKGTDGLSGVFAECLCGSPQLYQGGGRKPWNSINFICAHDGLTLSDLVSYNEKHNSANGEGNNDGEDHNNSWNCGQEGEFASLPVQRLRKRQMRNFFLCLMVSQGTPMIFMGDEYGHTKGGNNNTYCHDSYINYFRWDKKEDASSDFFRFCRLMTKFRRECESLGLDDFPTGERLQWHGHSPGVPDWSESSRFVAFSLMGSIEGEIYVAFNTSHLPVTIELPERPGYRWEPLVDTSKPSPYDFLSADLPDRTTAIQQYDHFLNSNIYPLLSYSSIILTLAPDDNS
ncbi:isoamylase 1, chloroplastic [Amborella trichopoda]|nr:isoamylase 1, chloroplastic [Amborella trichopoda]XP_020527019.1 isoamylase 1, chloroplastic [Amborella trichopoda]|eukprot:XP_006850946.2 isoamylase 1, chloroplastic [Amborella trichopoda]